MLSITAGSVDFIRRFINRGAFVMNPDTLSSFIAMEKGMVFPLAHSVIESSRDDAMTGALDTGRGWISKSKHRYPSMITFFNWVVEMVAFLSCDSAQALNAVLT